MSSIAIKPSSAASAASYWRSKLDRLNDQVAQWVDEEAGWSVVTQNITITEEEIGTYPAHVLVIETDKGRAILEPIAFHGFGVRGIVELYAWPTLYRVRLLMQADSDDWNVLTDSGIKLHQHWNRDSFISLVRDLVAA